ncbi:MAG: tetratricopeptide repeat protein [Planctomycetota bacterium]
MAARVNTRFVLIISAVMIGMAGAAVAAYFVLFQEDPEEMLARGEGYYAQATQLALQVDELEDPAAREDTFARSGEAYMFAAEMFGKAFEAKRTDVDILIRYVDTLERVHVDSALDAERILIEQERKLELATEISDRLDLLERYDAQMIEQLRWGVGPQAQTNILNRIIAAVDSKLQTDQENPVALKYRGIARTLRLNQESDLNDYRDAKEDLDRASEQLPDDAMIPMYTAKWHIAEANRLRQPNEGRRDTGPARPISDEVRAEVDKAVEISRAALERFGADDFETRFRHIENMLAFPVYREPEGEDKSFNIALIDEVREVVESMRVELIEDSSDMDAVLRLGDIMTRLDRDVIREEGQRGQTTTGIERTEALLRAAAKSEPLNVIYRVYLGNLLKLQMDLSDALAAYKEADAIAAVGPAEMILRELHFKRQARYEIANIELIQAENESDPEIREAKLKAADEAIEHLDKVLDEKAPVFLLKGKVAMLRGKDTVAMQNLDSAADLFLQDGNLNIEAMLLSARARQKERQWGAAAERLERVLDLPQIAASPESEHRLRTQLAEIYINSDRRTDARRELDRLQEIGVNPSTTSMLNAGLLLREGQIDEAVAAYTELGMIDQPSTVRNIARAMRRNADNAAATELIRASLDKNPASLPLIGELMSTLNVGDVDERRAVISGYLDAAEAAGAPSASVAALRAGITPVGDDEQATEQMIENLAQNAGDELAAELRRSSLWERVGDEGKSRAAYRRAVAIDANHPQVILTGIKFAAQDGNQRKLEELAERAAQENIDLANGDFVRGQIAAVQNDLNAAISFYNAGLAKRPVYDEGWKSLGDLYLRRNSLDDAAEAYQTAVNQKPDNVAALIALAEVNQQRRRYVAAVEAMRQAVRHAPDNPAVLQRYLQIEAEHGDPNEALKLRRELAERSPDSVQAQLGVAVTLGEMGRANEALEELDRIEADFPDSDLAGVITQARASIAYREGDPEEGRQVYEAYLEERGSDVAVTDLLTFARYLVLIQDSEASIEVYNRAIALDDDPTQPVVRELADRLFAMSQFQEAADQYEKLVAVSGADEGEAGARLMRRYVETLLRVGESEKAEELLDQQPRDAQTLVLRSIIKRQQDDAAAAEALLDEALELDPDYALGYLQRGLILATSNAEAALADANKALELDPQLSAAQQLRARLLMGLGDADEAIRGFNSVLARNPRDSVSRAALAELYLREGDLQTGRLVVSEGQRLEPTNPIWAQLEARFALAGGDPEQVILKLEEAVEAQPSPAALQALSEAYLNADRPEDVNTLLENHPAFVNQNVLLQARRGQALILTGRPEPGARLLGLAMGRSASVGQLAYVTRAAAESLETQRAFVLLDAAMSNANRPLDVLLAKAMVCMNFQDFAQALEFLPEAEKLAEERDVQTLLSVLRMTALCYYSTDQFESAEAAYRRILDKRSDDVESLNNLAFLLAKKLNRAEEALPLAEKAVSLTDPPQASVMDTLGIVQFMNGQIGRARETLENALLIDRDLAALHLHLAEVYYAENLMTKATQSLQEAIRLAELSRDRDTEAQARELQEQW